MPDANPTASLTLSIIDSLDNVSAEEWNRLGGDREPFLSYEFLSALERNHCLGQRFGWYSRHLTVRSQSGVLVGAMPMYIKTNSYGEFVFDWSWESAYTRSGLEYYPKLVSSIPYTPITGPRLLIADEPDSASIRDLMIEHAIKFAENQHISGVHWLFTNATDNAALQSHGLMRRLGCQYHWHNNDYADFEEFLESLTSSKRKKVRRERARVREQGVELRVIHGNEAGEEIWKQVHHFYQSTFDKKMGIPTLTKAFFSEIGRSMGEKLVLVMAEYDERIVACAINFRSENILYGRFWGCDAMFHSLHFEACYYQGIEYCIRHKQKFFEPGAQGEHKISRGFLPTQTWSYHWIAQEEFSKAIADFCQREERMMRQQCDSLMQHSPYREDAIPLSQKGLIK